MHDSRNEQFETSPETIEQELRPVVCEQRQTDRFKDNYYIDNQHYSRMLCIRGAVV